jgi:hypothetical protein
MSVAANAAFRGRPGRSAHCVRWYPGFALAGLRAGISLGDIGVLTLSLGNATKQGYRQHGSGIDGPGRSLVVAAGSLVPADDTLRQNISRSSGVNFSQRPLLRRPKIRATPTKAPPRT